MLGPIDYIVVGFRGHNFDGSIMDELSQAVGAGIIRVVDLFFIMKDERGEVSVGEYQDQPEEFRQALAGLGIGETTPLFAEEDIDKLAEGMEPDSAAGVLVIEQVWAKGLKSALLKADGVLLGEGRIHPDTVNGAVEELEHVAA